MSDAYFNKHFCKDVDEALVRAVQDMDGCFYCKTKENATKICTKCRVACYCSRECQLSDWKKKPKEKSHKEYCSIYCDNREAGECVPICMTSIGLLTLADCVDFMRNRKELFLDELLRLDDTPPLHFQFAVVSMFHGIFLMASSSFFSGGVKQINRIVFEPILMGEDYEDPNWLQAKDRLYPATFGDGGSISASMKTKVLDKIALLITELKAKNLELASITVGRGMMDLANGDLAKLAKENGNPGLMIVPSTDYAIPD